MKRTPEIFDKIEGYLNNTLSENEYADFEKEITANPELAQEVEKHRALHTILGDTDTLAFKEKLVKISTRIKEEEVSNNTPSNRFANYWKIAASIAIILGLGTFFWYTSTSTHDKTKELYLAYYQPFPIEDVTRGNTDTTLQHIMQHYSNKSYDSVVTALRGYANLANQEPLQLYLGNSYLNTNQEKKALSLFENIPNTSTYNEVATWYIALTHLKLNQPKKTIRLLKKIISYDGTYKTKASNLLKRLSE
ncbi:tetratricopeptide repeat protein [Aquimarina pacifica]|uniref:tetratricopeptide repeat protein n=1 Tax=Aquimarina pacifica TaxID=1296415 RepID=UPI00047178DD|nr:hypothetical protein [Aquimarina pacifica]